MISWTVIAMTSCNTDGDPPKEPISMDGICSRKDRLNKECIDKCEKEAKLCSDACLNATWTRVFCSSLCTLHDVTCNGLCYFDNSKSRLPIMCKTNTIET